MVRTVRSEQSTRRGIVLPFAALMLAATMAFVAFSVDWGYIVLTESELQTAADSAALAAAHALPTSRSAATIAAQTWAAKNRAAKSSVSLVTYEDIEFGAWDSATATFTPLPMTSMTAPNAIRVTCRRLASRGTGLKLFFAATFGTKSTDLRVSAIARVKDDVLGLNAALVQ
ncbi:hypothetical protein AYO47_02650 [Planctomyces sp. SCGC AG-212-M04]|nr:hypothetical protein AYO47_02650 [Planctomyces sp. SCGC AG-212-M04]